MKRFIVTLLVFVLLFVHAGFSEENVRIDVGSMSTEKLYELAEQIGDELTSRGEGVDFHSGVYIVGRDLPEGRYTVAEHSYHEDWNRAWEITVYKSDELKTEYETAHAEWQSKYYQAIADEDAGKEATYPQDLVTSNYLTYYCLKSGETLSLTVSSGEIIEVKKGSSEDGYLTISKSAPLFSD